jgi:hypothetical protein
VVDGRSLAGRFEVAQALNYSNRKQHPLAEGNVVVVVYIRWFEGGRQKLQGHLYVRIAVVGFEDWRD